MKKEKKILRIYLGDLSYTTIKTNYVVPLNIAYIAAYVKDKYHDQVDITLFKDPKALEKAIKKNPPEIIGLSNYSWNERLSLAFVNMAKRIKPDIITVMGGPNIRTHNSDIKKYLISNPSLDYYILYQGEEPFSNLVGKVLFDDSLSVLPTGCAGLANGELRFDSLNFGKKPKVLNIPSPYLSGFLDPFLMDPDMIPLFETNRGCPFGCAYCAWGIAAMSKLQLRPLEVIYEEMEYVASKSAKQINWIFGDANFGIIDRDCDIARKIRELMDKNGFPLNVTLWNSKNTSDRNIKIAKIIRDNDGYIAIQSTDPEVLKNSGRGNIKLSHLKKQIEYYKENNFSVQTDILVGLPVETAKSHLNSLVESFDLGFGVINPYNIRMLPGTKLESQSYREKYGIITKFRPIFGSYGIYDAEKVFEIEESVRATKDMSESELEGFKILHWLIYFSWNSGFFKPILFFALDHHINPALVLNKVLLSDHPVLRELFSKMKAESSAEWFNSKEEMIQYYGQQEHFDELINNFTKLNFKWIATAFQNPKTISALLNEIAKNISAEIDTEDLKLRDTWNQVIIIVNKLICKDLLQSEFIFRESFSGKALFYFFEDQNLAFKDSMETEIYRDKKDISYCNYQLCPNGVKDFSIQNLTRFLEGGGLGKLRNKIRIIFPKPF